MSAPILPNPAMCQRIRESGLAILQKHLPISIVDSVDVSKERVAFAVIDLVNGFCTPGAGLLAPPASDSVIESAIKKVDDLLCLAMQKRGRTGSSSPLLYVFRDCHDGPEPPYPPHCRRGSFEAQLVKKLQWLTYSANHIIDKPCINGWIGWEANTCKSESGCLTILNELNEPGFSKLIVVGVCTDICVMQFVQTVLSARNAGLIAPLQDVIVYVPGCATYDLPLEACRQKGLPDTAAHPRDFAHHLGLYLMQQSGAILAQNIVL